MENDEQTIGDLKARIAKTVETIESAEAADFEGSEDRDCSIEIPNGGGVIAMNGPQYLRSWALPHFYFHVVTAYDILRHHGVELESGTTCARSARSFAGANELFERGSKMGVLIDGADVVPKGDRDERPAIFVRRRTVIASAAKQSKGHSTRPLDCFVARAPRNDGRGAGRRLN